MNILNRLLYRIEKIIKRKDGWLFSIKGLRVRFDSIFSFLSVPLPSPIPLSSSFACCTLP